MNRFISSVFTGAVRSLERRTRRFAALAEFERALISQERDPFRLPNAAFYAACAGASMQRLDRIIERTATHIRDDLHDAVVDNWERGRCFFLRGRQGLGAMRERSLLVSRCLTRASHRAAARTHSWR